MSVRKSVVISCGGTISGKGTGNGSYSSGAVAVETLLGAVPLPHSVHEIEAIQFCSIGSQDMTLSKLQELAKLVNRTLERMDIAGVVIVHGTDTMEESAYFLNLTVNSRKPVVFTGAMRHADSLSADGPANLWSALAVSVSPEACGHGVLVVMNGIIHTARSVLKTHTSAVETFQSSAGGFGTLYNGSAEFSGSSQKRHTAESEFHAALHLPLPRVDLFFGGTGVSADLLYASVSLGAEGIVLAGVGNGNLSREVISACAELSAGGTAVVRASRVPYGPVTRGVEIDDDQFGFTVSGTLSPQKSRILLTAALACGIQGDAVQRVFNEY